MYLGEVGQFSISTVGDEKLSSPFDNSRELDVSNEWPKDMSQYSIGLWPYNTKPVVLLGTSRVIRLVVVPNLLGSKPLDQRLA